MTVYIFYIIYIPINNRKIERMRDMNKTKSFTLLITGVSDNEPTVKRLIGGDDFISYKLQYAPPYANFDGIKEFQIESRYKPFEHSNKAFKYAAIDVSEWVGHEQEEYIECFFKFLHDYDGFFDFKYIFTIGKSKDWKSIYLLAAKYLEEGEVICDRTFVDAKHMSSFISKEYKVVGRTSSILAELFIEEEISSYAEIETIMNDIRRYSGREKIDIKDIHSVAQNKHSKIYYMYGSELNKKVLDKENIM